MRCIMHRHPCVACVRLGSPSQADCAFAKLWVEEVWRASLQAECLAEWLTYMGATAYEAVRSHIEACEDGTTQMVAVAALLQTLIDCNQLPAKVLEDAQAVWGRPVEVEELVSLYTGVT